MMEAGWQMIAGERFIDILLDDIPLLPLVKMTWRRYMILDSGGFENPVARLSPRHCSSKAE
jgi:hypothetical protein